MTSPRKRISSKAWMACFAASVLLLLFLLAGFNVATDPFGLFGDKLMDWYSYNMTLNPRVAKTAYLKDRLDQYDSYVIGCSSTSSFPVEELNRYLDASFYNLIMYGADMKDVEKTVAWLLREDDVKHILLNVYIDNGMHYDIDEDTLTQNLHQKVSGAPAVSFYGKYLLLNPRFGYEKWLAFRQDSWLQKPVDVFIPETGTYDKKRRDIERIGDMETYLKAYPVFKAYPRQKLSLPETDRCMESIAAIRDMCREAGVKLDVVSAPVYGAYLENFDPDVVKHFYTRLAQTVPYWDFTFSSVSWEPRYFYDDTHFRNDVGRMALARMYGEEADIVGHGGLHGDIGSNGDLGSNGSGVYIPDDFGVYVTADTVARHLERYPSEKANEGQYTVKVPILMYHHISEEGNGSTIISERMFRTHLQTLRDNGYETVSLYDLRAYVERGAPLPQKPVVITFDDGYLSNYEIAWPLLEEFGMQATIFLIGSTVGQTETYKDTDYPITPHFGYEQAAEMVASGVIAIQSHTYDMHQWAPFEETGKARTDILRFPDEPEADYIQVLREDFTKSRDLIELATGQLVEALAFPLGRYDELSQALLAEMGVRVTMSTEPGVNLLVKGIPQSLLAMRRNNMEDSMTPERLLKLLGE